MLNLSINVKQIKMNKIVLILMVLIFGCKNNNDPFRDISPNNIKHDEFESQMLNKGVFKEPNKDSTLFRYYISSKNMTYPVEIAFNTDNYNFGGLRNIYINLNGDTIYESKRTFLRASGSRLKKEVDEIYDIYCNWYGKPDTILNEYPLKKNDNTSKDFSFYDLVRESMEKELNELPVDSSATPSRTVIWNREDFELSFYIPFPVISSHLDSSWVYNHAEINYKSMNYDIVLNKIKDSIRKTFTPKDLIVMDINNPKWSVINSQTFPYYDSKFEFTVVSVFRKDREEPRGITGVRFDIVISDVFNKELCRIENLTYEPQHPIMNKENGDLYSIVPFSYITKYLKKSTKSYNFEKAKNYSYRNKVKVFADIKSVVFDDGGVLE